MEMSPNTAQNQQRTVSTVLFLSGLAFIGAGLAIGFFVSPIGFVGLVIGAVDLVLARHFVPDRTGTILPPDETTHADPDLLAADAEADATANPYARED